MSGDEKVIETRKEIQAASLSSLLDGVAVEGCVEEPLQVAKVPTATVEEVPEEAEQPAAEPAKAEPEKVVERKIHFYRRNPKTGVSSFEYDVFPIRQAELDELKSRPVYGLVDEPSVDEKQKKDLAEVKHTFNDNSLAVRALLEPDQQSGVAPIGTALAELAAKEAETKDDGKKHLWMIVIDRAHGIARTMPQKYLWEKPKIIDGEEEKFKKRNPEVMAIYDRCEPEATGVRLVVINNMFYSSVTERLFIGRFWVFIAKYDAGTELAHFVPSEERVPGRTHCVFDMMRGVVPCIYREDAEKTVMALQAHAKFLSETHALYRFNGRVRLCAQNMPVLREFLQISLAGAFVEIHEEAGSAEPERVIIVTETESCGTVVDLSSTEIKTESHMRATLRAMRNELHKLPPTEELTAEKFKLMKQIKATETLLGSMTKNITDPRSQVLCYAADRGHYQDFGIPVESTHIFVHNPEMLKRTVEIARITMKENREKMIAQGAKVDGAASAAASVSQ
jgi:hypothetical protein